MATRTPIIMGPDGKLRQLQYGDDVTNEDMWQVLSLVLAEQRLTNLLLTSALGLNIDLDAMRAGLLE